MLKATFQQDDFNSKLSENVKAMDLHSRRFQEVAEQCAFQTQVSTLAAVNDGHSALMHSIERSQSDAALHQSLTSNALQLGRKSVEDLHSELRQFKADQASVASELNIILKDFTSSNGRIDRRTNDSQWLHFLPKMWLMIIVRRPLPFEVSQEADVYAIASNLNPCPRKTSADALGRRRSICNRTGTCCS